MNKRVVVADDEPMIRRAIEFKLQKEGYSVESADDGQKAKDLIEANKPDLVITDIMMPYVSGLELITAIRRTYQSDVKIIVLSAVGQEEKVLEAFQLGADDFVNKPFSPLELTLRVKNLLGR